MKEITRWDRFVDWLDFVLSRFGLVRVKHHRILGEFYRDWLIDIAENEPISEQEKGAILAMRDGINND